MIYKVTIEETVCDEFDVEADSKKEAFDIAIEKYRNCEFVLEPGELKSKRMLIHNKSSNKRSNWKEF